MQPERSLWSDVVRFAMSEAECTNEGLRSQARKWLLGDSDDFRKVCEYAGLIQTLSPCACARS